MVGRNRPNQTVPGGVQGLPSPSHLLRGVSPTEFTLVSCLCLLRMVNKAIGRYGTTSSSNTIQTEFIMTTPAAYGIYPPSAALNDIVHTLYHAGFVNEDICMMLSPSHPIAGMVREAGFHDSDRQTDSVAAKLIGWLSEFGAVMIPTVGFFIRSQNFFRALVCSDDAPGLCGESTTLAGLGFNATDAFRFEEQLRHTGVLIYIACPEGSKTGSAMELLRSTGAREAATLAAEELEVAVA
jgi:hypothetical protein